MPATNERTKSMMNNFIALKKDEGKSIEEIAEIFSVSKWTVYERLQEIADANGVPRDELLDIPHKKHFITQNREFSAEEKINPEDLKILLDNLSSQVDEIINKIDGVIPSEMQ